MAAKKLGDTTDDGALLLGGPGYVPPVTFGGAGGRKQQLNPYTKQPVILRGSVEESFLGGAIDYGTGGLGGDAGDGGSSGGGDSGDGGDGGGGPAGDGGDY